MAGDYWWEPLVPAEVAALLEGVAAPWWFAGGYALEFFAGAPYRKHSDIDVAFLREDQTAIHEHLRARGWDVHMADPPGTLRPWPPGEVLPAHVHDIWCRATEDGPWALQLMLDDRDGEEWRFRRDARIRRALDGLTWTTAEGWRVLAPEVQLLYKSGSMREKDARDFEVVAPLLSPEQRSWLREALAVASPGHEWSEGLV